MIIHCGPDGNFPQTDNGQFTWRIGAGEVKNCQVQDWFTPDELFSTLTEAREDAYKYIASISERGHEVKIAYLSGRTPDGRYSVSSHTQQEAFTDKLVFVKPTLFCQSFWGLLAKDTRELRIKAMAIIDGSAPSDTVGFTWKELYHHITKKVS